MNAMTQLGAAAKQAARFLALQTEAQKNTALMAMAVRLEADMELLLEANRIDLEAGRQNGLSESLLDRLALSPERVRGMADGMRDVCALPDPVGEVELDTIRPNGLHIQRVRVPMGVIGIIYEARPNVTADAAALCLKAGSAVILRGGKEAIHSNRAIAASMRSALGEAGFPEDCIALVQDTSRETAAEMMRCKEYLDLLIPRGGAGLIRAVVEQATVPVIETGVGNCHVYVDRSADLAIAAEIVYNAKTSRPSVCNACESLLVHRDVAAKFLPLVARRLKEKSVELRGCEHTRAILGDSITLATEEDYATEFLDYILSVKVVDSLEEAIDHIDRYSSGHSECIVTGDDNAADAFLRAVDSAAVYVNASTRFTDGGEFGFGAEIGISTQKLHARGPMGLRELTSTKYLIHGNGQIR